MENYNNNKLTSSRVWSGLLILGIGLILLLSNLGLNIPNWLFRWPMLLIVIGLFTGIKRNFTGIGWLIMVLIGSYFTLDRMVDLNFDLSKYALTAGFIILGIYLIVRPKKSFKNKFNTNNPLQPDTENAKTKNTNNADMIDSVNVFSGSQANIYSKNFKGGDIVAIFGGADVNLTQADFEGTITLDVTAIFGGIKLIIPPNWEVKSEVTPLFGGFEDRRGFAPIDMHLPRKIIIIRGVAIFGGVDIKNF